MAEKTRDLVIRVAGEGGEGVISCGEMLALALARSGYQVYTFRTYPAEIKGGPAMYQVRVSDDPVYSQGDQVDVLVTFNNEAFQLHGKMLKADGTLVYDPDEYQPEGPQALLAVPLNQLSMNVTKSKRGKNVVALGAIARLLNLSLELVERMVREKFGKKGDAVLSPNLLSLKAGWDYAAARSAGSRLPSFPAVDHPQRFVMSGNEALSLGAVHAGCRFYSGYPITPASDILEFMDYELPKFGGAVVQTEDEIAAVTSAIGASFAGKKSMTATSGPGLSLMVEGLGLAFMTETPVVVVDAQRGSPSTGLPTKNEQGDLILAALGAHGDAPRIVVAPGDVEECFYFMVQAFNLSERYQTPVIFLTDQSLAHSTQTFPLPDFSQIQIINRDTPTDKDLKDYKRYRITESGVSPMTVPGREGCYMATGLEHNEEGDPNFTPANHMAMTAKRMRKLERASQEKGFTKRFGPGKARLGIIGWGSTQGAIREAVEKAEAQGLSVAALCVKMPYPLPEQDLREFLGSVEKVMVAELNHLGQFNMVLRSRFLLETHLLGQTTGLPFNPDTILQKAKDILDGKDDSRIQVRSQTDLVSRLR